MSSTTPARPALPAFPLTIAAPALNEGEIWAGIVSVGAQLHHVILLPGDKDAISWHDARTWAAEHDGDLPTRLELSLLWTNCRDHFKEDAHWSNEQHASEPRYAWCQSFLSGIQYYYDVDTAIRARAVRRISI